MIRKRYVYFKEILRHPQWSLVQDWRERDRERDRGEIGIERGGEIEREKGE